MKSHKRRIGLWFIVILALSGIVAYLYFNRSIVIAPKSLLGEKTSPKGLTYLKSDASGQVLMSHDFESGDDKILVSTEKLGQFIHLSDARNLESGLLLSKLNNQIILRTVNLKNGNLETLSNLTKLNPRKIFELSDGRLVAIAGDKGEKLILLNKDFNEVGEYTNSDEITYAYAKNSEDLEFADFNGSKATVFNLDIKNSSKQEVGNLDGQISRFDDSKILFAKRINEKSDQVDNPAGKTFWKIGIKNWNEGNESLISDGNFDQNPISDDNSQVFAYQKKFNTEDQADGRIFVVGMESQNDRLSEGVPLLFSY